MRVDSHIHIFPDAAAADPKGFAEEHKETHWLKLVAPASQASIQGWANAEQCLRDMDTAGIDIAVMQGWYWENGNTCAQHNKLYAEILSKWPDRFRGFACFHPGLVKQDKMWIDSLVDQGFSGIGELLPVVQGYDFETVAFTDVLAQAERAGLWVNFHVTEPAGGKYPGHVETPLQAFVDCARAFPDLKIILSHLGGGLCFFSQNRSIRKYLRNVYYDTAAWPLIYAAEATAQAIKLAGPQVLYGTDYPLRTFPKRSLGAQMTSNLNAFDALPEIEADTLHSILNNGSQIRSPRPRS